MSPRPFRRRIRFRCPGSSGTARSSSADIPISDSSASPWHRPASYISPSAWTRPFLESADSCATNTIGGDLWRIILKLYRAWTDWSIIWIAAAELFAEHEHRYREPFIVTRHVVMAIFRPAVTYYNIVGKLRQIGLTAKWKYRNIEAVLKCRFDNFRVGWSSGFYGNGGIKNYLFGGPHRTRVSSETFQLHCNFKTISEGNIFLIITLAY